ncbi:MAG TPA: PepSY domain-containing protein [Thermoanaerobaculia bacterium]|nr:PepSY domain-containing protein [Thermoanaerobaculia bacterium]
MKKTAVLLTLALLALLAGCASRSESQEISKERAIELAREHVEFEPGNIEAVKETEEGRPVWRVTFYGKGVSATQPGEVMFVLLDRKTGEVVSLGMS